MAVYTEVSDAEIASLLKRYDVGRLLSFRGIAEGVENTNYMVHTTSGQMILTLYEKRVAETDLPFFLGLMEHLAANGLSCPVPLRDCDGRNLNQLAGRSAALVTFLEGFWLRKPEAPHCRQVGAALARLHLAGASFEMQRPNALGLEGWRDLYGEIEDSLDAILPNLDREIASELDTLAARWPSGLPSGVIHADLFPDNVFFLGDDLSGLIDFYFACNDAFAYDLAICLNAWCFGPDFTFDPAKGQALIEGYQTVRELQPDERAAFPTLAEGAALRFLLTRSADWIATPPGALVKPHDPRDYLARLQFHRTAKTIADYGYTDSET